MEKMKFMVLGLGNYGQSWAFDVMKQCQDVAEFIVAVDKDSKKHVGLPEGVAACTDLEEALTKYNIDAVINVTTPNQHTSINKQLLQLGLKVLCEKPIAGSVQDAMDILNFIDDNKYSMMIAENYRYNPIFRKSKELLDQGVIGDIHNIRCIFTHYHPDYSKYYHGNIDHPLLLDVTIHHLDVARYLTGAEPVKVQCYEWDAPYSWYGKRPATATILTQMTKNIRFQYMGTLAATASTTDWNGYWEIEGSKGTVTIKKDTIAVKQDDNMEPDVITVKPNFEDSRVYVLREFIEACQNNRLGETDIHDNIKTYSWVQECIKYSEKNN